MVYFAKNKGLKEIKYSTDYLSFTHHNNFISLLVDRDDHDTEILDEGAHRHLQDIKGEVSPPALFVKRDPTS